MQILPDSSCSGIVLKMLVKAEALPEALKMVQELTSKGIALSATAAADVLGALESYIALADCKAFQLLQAELFFLCLPALLASRANQKLVESKYCLISNEEFYLLARLQDWQLLRTKCIYSAVEVIQH